MPTFAFLIAVSVFVLALLPIRYVLFGYSRIAIAAAHRACERVTSASLVCGTCRNELMLNAALESSWLAQKFSYET